MWAGAVRVRLILWSAGSSDVVGFDPQSLLLVSPHCCSDALSADLIDVLRAAEAEGYDCGCDYDCGCGAAHLAPLQPTELTDASTDELCDDEGCGCGYDLAAHHRGGGQDRAQSYASSAQRPKQCQGRC